MEVNSIVFFIHCYTNGSLLVMALCQFKQVQASLAGQTFQEVPTPERLARETRFKHSEPPVKVMTFVVDKHCSKR